MLSAIALAFRALPASVKVALGGMLVVVAVSVRYTIQIHGLRGEIKKLTATASEEKAAKAVILGQLADVTSNRDQLERRIREQNRAIEVLQTRGRQLESAAALAAVRVLREGEATSRALRTEPARVEPGHEGMNLWLREQFTR